MYQITFLVVSTSHVWISGRRAPNANNSTSIFVAVVLRSSDSYSRGHYSISLDLSKRGHALQVGRRPWNRRPPHRRAHRRFYPLHLSLTFPLSFLAATAGSLPLFARVPRPLAALVAQARERTEEEQ